MWEQCDKESRSFQHWGGGGWKGNKQTKKQIKNKTLLMWKYRL